MSIRVLLDHGVREDHIIFVAFLVAAGGGISVIRRAFPSVKVVCGEVDGKVREVWMEPRREPGKPDAPGRRCWIIEPGMGQIGTDLVASPVLDIRLTFLALKGIVITYEDIFTLA
jgi:uridine kinase